MPYLRAILYFLLDHNKKISGPLSGSYFICDPRVWWWSMTEWSAWSRIFLTLAQSENVPHLQRRHSTGPSHLCPDTFSYTGSSLWFPQTSHIYRCCCHSSGFADVDCQILKVNKTDGKEWSQSKVFRSWCSSLVCWLSISTAFEKVIHTQLWKLHCRSSDFLKNRIKMI